MPSARSIVRIVLMVVCVAIALYLLYLLRTPIGWLLIAIFLARGARRAGELPGHAA